MSACPNNALTVTERNHIHHLVTPILPLHVEPCNAASPRGTDACLPLIASTVSRSCICRKLGLVALCLCALAAVSVTLVYTWTLPGTALGFRASGTGAAQ